MSNNKKVTAKELIRNSLEEMKKVFENDTEEFLNDVNLIQQLNTNESLKLVKLQEKLECMVKDSQEIRDSSMYQTIFDKLFIFKKKKNKTYYKKQEEEH